MKLLKLLSLIILCFIISCSRNSDLELSSDDYFIFGIGFGECIGNCVEYYMIRDGALFQDELDWGFPDPESFSSIARDDSEYNEAIKLLEDFPQSLIDDDKEVYGCPDCADQGGVYLALNSGDISRFWRIDTDDVDQNEEIIGFKKRVMELLDELE